MITKTKAPQSSTSHGQPVDVLRQRRLVFNAGGRAQAMVEFALVLPVLLLLLLAIIDFGRVLFIFSEVSNATREAVRYGAVNPTDCTEIENRARSMMSLVPSNAINVSVIVEKPDSASGGFVERGGCGTAVQRGDRLRISVNTTVQFIALQLFAPLFGGKPPDLPINYTSSRSVVPPEGISTGPTTTPRPTKTLVPLIPDTPTPVPPPPAPSGFSATSNCSNPYKVNGSWSPVAGADGYRIFKLPDAVEVWSGTSTSANDFDRVGPDTSTTYYVVAYNSGGDGAGSNFDIVTCGPIATNTLPPSPTPTDTPTPTSTPTNTPTRTPTPTPTNTSTPTSTPTQTPTIPPGSTSTYTPTPTHTPTPSLTPTPEPTLEIQFAPGYPAQKRTGQQTIYIEVIVTYLGTPVPDADVSILDPYDPYPQLTYLGNGRYGWNGSCWFRNSASQGVSIKVWAWKLGFEPTTLGPVSSDVNTANICP